MATLIEPDDFPPGIYQLEDTDPVKGGTPNEATGDGMDNIPHAQLARRTRWLKNRVDELLGAVIAATTAVAGIVRLSSSVSSTSETLAATSKAVKAANDNAEARALKATTITASGLATGGGSLAASRTITVSDATQAEAEAGTSNTKAMSPMRVAQAIAARVGLVVATGGSGYLKIGGIIIQWGGTATGDANGLAAAVWPISFPTACWRVIGCEVTAAANGASQVAMIGWIPDLTTVNHGAFRVATTDNVGKAGEIVTYIAIGH